MNNKLIIKICGVKEADIAVNAAKLGADMIGLMFYRGSKRNINIDAAKSIVNKLEEMQTKAVAVFVDADANDMQAICEVLNITIVQLHGEISRNEASKLPQAIQRIYAIDFGNEKNQQTVYNIKALNPSRDLLLFDNENGGSGQTVDYNNFYNPYNLKFLIAGGLNSQNVIAAISKVKPAGVDVSSGVEKYAGIKDLEKIQKFINNVRTSDVK